MLFLCRCYILPSKLLSCDSGTPDLVINTGIEEVELCRTREKLLMLCNGMDIPFHYHYKNPMVLHLCVFPISPHSAVEEPFVVKLQVSI